ncbi:hypothetical protein B0H13DRAFT_2326046 [Mycena leptocephala]|nr:hypothetical protein B0H13DRAFT_2326046 [Mycena leptocephala]
MTTTTTHVARRGHSTSRFHNRVTPPPDRLLPTRVPGSTMWSFPFTHAHRVNLPEHNSIQSEVYKPVVAGRRSGALPCCAYQTVGAVRPKSPGVPPFLPPPSPLSLPITPLPPLLVLLCGQDTFLLAHPRPEYSGIQA